MPPRAVGYVNRPDTGLGLPDQLARGETVILADSDKGLTHGLGGLGGTGKSQLASAVARYLLEATAIDLLVWVPASSRDAILTSYALALRQVGTPDRDQDAETTAGQFVQWLASTSRPWLVVLDDVADPEDLEGLWPQGATGRTLVTTRRLDASLAQRGRRVEHVDVFTRREALTYLKATLDREQRVEALDLADDLGCLPLALDHAGAAIASGQYGCREYRSRLAERMERLNGPASTGYPAIVVASWWLSLDTANQLPPAGSARPALTLASLLGSAGIPGAVVTSLAACDFVDRHSTVRGDGGDESQARHALHNLSRLGLVAIDAGADARTVRVHPLVQAAVRDSLSAEDLEVAVRAAGSALLEAWPADEAAQPHLAQALRECASSLQEASGKLLWEPEAHPVLARAGESMDAARLTGPAISYWQAMTETGSKVLGPRHSHTLRTRDKWASACLVVGRYDDAIEICRRTLADRERIYGPGHQESLISRASLADAYHAAGRLAEAIPLFEQTISEQAWLLGPEHTGTWRWRASLAAAYQAAGRAKDAVPLYERIVADTELVREPGHADILAAFRGLAGAYQAADRPRDVIRTHERIVADVERSNGPDHPETLTAKADLAQGYLLAGRLKDAIRHSKRNMADRERVLGPDHPDTLSARVGLADAHLLAGHLKDAIVLHERTLADRERVMGASHPDTATSRAGLASAYHSAGRLAEAIPMYKRAIADSEQLRGIGHTDTITLRGNLAHAYHTVGRPADAIALLERTLADSERYLGPDHALTQTMRENYDTINSA
jgi:tetratricopeptide (TPR) repeat protein